MEYQYLPASNLIRVSFPFPLTPPPQVIDIFFSGRDIVMGPDGWTGVTCTTKEWEKFLVASYESAKPDNEGLTVMIAEELLEFRKWKLEVATSSFFWGGPEMQA